MLESKRIAYKNDPKGVPFSTTLEGASGKIVAQLPEDISQVCIKGPTAIKRGASAEFMIDVKEVSGRNIKGVIPLRIKVVEPDGKVNSLSVISSMKKKFDYSKNFIMPAALNDPIGE